MKAAHQNVSPIPLPGSYQPQNNDSGGFLSSLFPGNARAPAPVQPMDRQQQVQQNSNQGYPPPPPNTQARPPVTQTSSRPEADAGLDGWLIDRVFGGRR
jgi:penicillin-binding protein 1A